MGNFPGVTVPAANQGGIDAVIGPDPIGVPMTLVGNRLGTALAKVKVAGRRLYARLTASPYKARPFMENGVIANPTNLTNATVDIPDADAVKFKVNDVATYYDVSAVALHTETKVVSAIGAAGSGGAGETLVTFTGVWTTPPVATDLLVVADGSELSKNVVVVLEDITFDGSTEFSAVGYYNGTFKKSLISNADRFIQANNQNVQLMDLQ